MPSRVDFYILNSTRDQDRWSLLSTLLTRQWPKGHRFHIHLASEQECKSLDQYLWQSDITSFLPHHCLGETVTDMSPHETEHQDLSIKSPITLGHPGTPAEQGDILVNFAEELPVFYTAFERVLEIVVQDPHWLKIQREHYRFFREKGLTPHIHKMG